MKAIAAGAVIAAAVTSGCNVATGSADLVELKRGLGPVQYIALDPQLSFTVQNAQFEPPEDRVDSPTMRYTVNIKQHNSTFPLVEYNITAYGSVIDPAGNTVDDIYFAGRVENGVLSVAGVDEMYGADALVTAQTAPALRLRVDRYDWAPIMIRTPYTPPR